jgi:hypothetical protein
MEYNENPNETIESENEDDEQESGNMKQWFQDNLRIVISVLIVVVIAAGIYSYSNRTITSENKGVSQEESQGNVAGEENASQEKTTQTQTEEKNQKQAESTVKQDQTSSVATSQETDKSFVETAARGDGTTKLARRALVNYLEKNTDSSLTAEHKIYIEDYLRKNISFRGKVRIGTSVEFSKDLISQAVSKSKTLNENQLKNLHKYAVRVPSLS